MFARWFRRNGKALVAAVGVVVTMGTAGFFDTLEVSDIWAAAAGILTVWGVYEAPTRGAFQ